MPACSLVSTNSAARRETYWSRQHCDASLSSVSGPATTSARSLDASCMGQRLSTSNTMATNVEKTEGEEKTFVCAVSTGS